MAAGVSRYWRTAGGLVLHSYDYAAEAGTARLPVVCLHGLTRNGRDFGALAPWLAARGRRVLAPDMRGRGLSDWDPAAEYRLPAYADDVARLCAALGIAGAHFVGTSMGGLITMQLAETAPALVAGAVINDVGPVLAPAGLARIAGYAGKAPEVRDWAEAAAYARWQNAQALPHYGEADWAAMARRLFRERDGVVRADYDPAIARAFGDPSPAADPWARWAALADARPVLLLRGALSDLLDAETAAAMAAGRADVRLVTVPAVGHAPMLEEPAALAAIAAFLEAQP